MHGLHYVNGQLVPNQMNPIRRDLLDKIQENLIQYKKTLEYKYMMEAQRFNREFVERSRGKGRG